MSFDRIAPHYRWLERILAGEKLQCCRLAFLEEIPVPETILILGEGHGRALAACCRQFPHAAITVVEASARMIATAREYLRKDGLSVARVHFLHINALTWTPPVAAYDLIVTHFFLDCFNPEQLARFIPVLARAARPQANWLVADFQMAPSGLARLRSQAILALMYAFFRCTTRLSASRLADPSPWLTAAGFRPHRKQSWEWGLLHTTWWHRPPGGHLQK